MSEQRVSPEATIAALQAGVDEMHIQIIEATRQVLAAEWAIADLKKRVRRDERRRESEEATSDV